MTEYAIAARLEVDRVALEVIEVGGEYGEVLNTLYIEAAAAVRFGEGLIRLGRLVGVPLACPTVWAEPVRVLTLAVPTDPHAEDGA